MSRGDEIDRLEDTLRAAKAARGLDALDVDLIVDAIYADPRACTHLADERGALALAVLGDAGVSQGARSRLSASRDGDLALSRDPDRLPATNDDGRNALMTSIICGRLDCARKLVGIVNVSAIDFGGWSALMYATRHGLLDVVHLIIAAGADVAYATRSGTTALFVASRWGRVDCALALIDNGANVGHAGRDGSTALMHASRAGHVTCARTLVYAGALVGRVDVAGKAALAHAATAGQLDSVRTLLEAGADIAQACKRGWTALFWACRFGHANCARALIAASADVSAIACDSATALMVAAQYGQVATLHVLIECGAVIAYRSQRYTALALAARHKRLECARALLDAGAAPTSSFVIGGVVSLNMLTLLCAYMPSRLIARRALGRLAASSMLFKTWLDSTCGWTTPLHHLEFLSTVRVRALLRSGADVHAGDKDTPHGIATRRLASDPLDERAALVVRAAAPWSPCAHDTFPDAARSRAVELVRIGAQLARVVEDSVEDATHAQLAFRDVWLAHVMPHAIDR